jgi:hypothetical protein
MATVSSTILPGSWTEILDNVQKALAQAESEAIRSVQALESAIAAEGGNLPEDFERQQGMDDLDQQFSRLEECAGEASRTVAETEAALARSEEALRQWLAMAEAIRRKLANQAGVSV